MPLDRSARRGDRTRHRQHGGIDIQPGDRAVRAGPLSCQPRDHTSATRDVEDALAPTQPGCIEEGGREGHADRRDEVPLVVLGRVAAVLLE